MKSSAQEWVTEVTDDEKISHDRWKPTPRELALMVSLAIISFMIALDATIVVTSLSTIVIDLHLDTTQGFWIGTSYLLASAVCMPFIASISDIFGRLWCLLASLVFFTAGTLLCCLTNSVGQIIAGRCVQGVGGGGIVICSLVIFTDIVPLRFRSKWYGIIQGAWALGTCIGPITGGLFVAHTTWRWIFYVMFPFCAIGFSTIPLTLKMTPRSGSLLNKLARIDWTGAVLFIASITAFLVAISSGGTQYAWNSVHVLVPLVLGLVGILLTCLWEAKGAKHPFLKRELFNCGSAFAVYLGTVINGFIIYGTMYYIPVYFLAVKAHDAVETGVDILPAAASLAPTSVIVGILISRFGKFRWAIVAGWLITTGSTGLFYYLDVNTKTSIWAGLLVLLGIGEGLVLNSTNFASQAMAPYGNEGSAAAMYAFMRSFGMALGVGISSTVFQNAMHGALGDLGLDTSIAAKSEAYIEIMKTMPAAQADPIRSAFVVGVQGTNVLFCSLSMLGLISSLFIKHFEMNRDLESDHKLRKSVSYFSDDESRPSSR